MLSCLAGFIKELGRYPTVAEIRMQGRNHPDFPTHNVYSRQGRKAEWATNVRAFCDGKPEYEDVARICEPLAKTATESTDAVTDSGADGFVYLMKSGKHYKIGFTNSVDRRQYELGPKLPLGIEPIHSIRTDDPAGIEAYWHRRFKDKHMNGEWFDLSPKDVAAFKRRKFM